MLLIFILYASIASTFIVNKILLQYLSPITLTTFRMLISGFLLVGFYWFFKQKKK